MEPGEMISSQLKEQGKTHRGEKSGEHERERESERNEKFDETLAVQNRTTRERRAGRKSWKTDGDGGREELKKDEEDEGGKSAVGR